MDNQEGRGASKMSTLLDKSYLVKLPDRGEGCSKKSEILSKGPSINYVITQRRGGGCEIMMFDDGRGEGVRT